MNYTKNLESGICRVSMKGKFTFSDHQSYKELFDVFSDAKIEKLEINISEVDFIDSAALGLLLLTRDEAEKYSKKLVLVSPQGQVKKMFDISRFYELFEIKG